MDQLLDGHAAMLNTQEGRVFESFHQQLDSQSDIMQMRSRIQQILAHPAASLALDDLQRVALKLLVQQLLKEAKVVQAVRARSEREVGQFMKTGQAAENLRVGQLLNDVLHEATLLDWSRQSLRRKSAPLPPLGISLGGLPIIERLRLKSLDGGGESELLLTTQYADLTQVEDEFWQAFEGLDRQALFDQTFALLEHSGLPLTLAALAQAIPPGKHDLETLTLWIAMAREADINPADDLTETIVTSDETQQWEFTVPLVTVDAAHMQHTNGEL